MTVGLTAIATGVAIALGAPALGVIAVGIFAGTVLGYAASWAKNKIYGR